MAVDEEGAAAAVETPTAAALAAGDDDLLTRLRVATNDDNLDDETAKFFLEMFEGNVEHAAAFYKEQAPTTAPVDNTRGSVFTSSLTNSSQSGGSRRRTSSITIIPTSVIEPGSFSSRCGLNEPGVGLVRTRHGRGFANNVNLLGSAAEFEYLGGPRPSMVDTSLNRSLNIQSDVFGFSTPGAFHEYQDGADGYYARERRESATLQNHNSAPARLNIPAHQRPNDRHVTAHSMPQPKRSPATRRQNPRSNIPKRCESDPYPSNEHFPHKVKASDHGPSPKRRNTTSTLSASQNQWNFDCEDDEHEGDERMAVSSQSHQRRCRDSNSGMARLKTPPDTTYDAALQNSWTGKSLFARKSISTRDSTATTVSALSESQLEWSQTSLMTSPEDIEEHFDFHEDEYQADDYAHDNGLDLDNEEIFVQSHTSNQHSQVRDRSANGSRPRFSIRSYATEPNAKPVTKNEEREMLQALQAMAFEENDAMGRSDNSNQQSMSGGSESCGNRRGHHNLRSYATEPNAKPITKLEDNEMVRILQAIASEDFPLSPCGEDNPGIRMSNASSAMYPSSDRRDPNSRQGGVAKMMPTELSIHEEATVGFMGSSSAVAAFAYKPDPPGDRVTATWLHEEESIDAPSHHSRSPRPDDDDEGAKKPAARPSRLKQHDRVKQPPATSPRPINSGLDANEPGVIGSNAEVQLNCNSNVKLATDPGAVNVGFAADEYGRGKDKKTPATRLGPDCVGVVLDELGRAGCDQHHREPPRTPNFTPRRTSAESQLSSSTISPPAPLRYRKYKRPAATRPGAVGAPAGELGNNDSRASEKMNIEDSVSSLPARVTKVRRAPATKPGAFELPENSEPSERAGGVSPKGDGKGLRLVPATVLGAINVVSVDPRVDSTTFGSLTPSERDRSLSPKGGGKGVRLVPATVPGAVNVVSVEPLGDSTTSCSLENREQDCLHSLRPQPILAPTGKVRHRPGSRPGAFSVSGTEDIGSKNKSGKPTGAPKASEPGAVNVIGDEKSKKGGTEKTSGLRRSGVKPGAVIVTSASDQTSKTGEPPLVPEPEVVSILDASSHTVDECTMKAQNDSNDKNSLSSLENGESSHGPDIVSDDAVCDDPTLEQTTESRLATGQQIPQSPNGETVPFAPLPLPPRGAAVGPPHRMLSSDPRCAMPSAPVPTPDKRRRPASEAKGKMGGIRGLFKRKSKDKEVKQDPLGFEDDDSILTRIGTSRAFSISRKPPT